MDTVLYYSGGREYIHEAPKDTPVVGSEASEGLCDSDDHT